MKIWYQHGSEHSANLVMIGHFKDATEAIKAKEIIDAITKQVEEDRDAGTLVPGSPSDLYGTEMLNLLARLNVASIGPRDLGQFAQDAAVTIHDEKIVITTDETDIAAYLNVMIQRGARVEVFSAHDHPGTGYGRGK